MQISTALVPPHQRQIVIDAVCKQNLVQIDDPVMEGCRTRRQVQIPHTDKPLVKNFPYFIRVFMKIFHPTQQCAVIMLAQIFYIYRMEVPLRRAGKDLPQTRNHTSSANILFDLPIA